MRMLMHEIEYAELETIGARQVDLLPTRVTTLSNKVTQQLVKWPGGKRQLLPAILARLPATPWSVYREPFLGGASVFLYLRASGLAPHASVSDSNVDLVTLYRTAQNQPDELVRRVQYLACEISQAQYYAIRSRFNKEWDASALDRSAWFLYLNHLAFNGLYRVNLKGEFNAPYCHPEKYGGGGARKHSAAEIVREEAILAAAKFFTGVDVECRDFREAIASAAPGDFVYMDPPYWPRSPTASFTAYAGVFGPIEQKVLADAARDLDKRGVMWLLSNSDVPQVRELYQGFRIETVMARRSINRNADGRGAVAEVLISNY